MPHRVYLVISATEILFLNTFNIVLLITWENAFAAIPILFSTIYSIVRIKRDIKTYYKGSYKKYFLFLIGKAKK